MKRRWMAAIPALALVLTGCAATHAETSTQANTQNDGGNWLPTYVQDLQSGKLPLDHCAPPETLGQLLWPCDTPRDHIEHELGHMADDEH